MHSSWETKQRDAAVVGSFGPISGLHKKVLRNHRHFWRQLLLKQSNWLNLRLKIINCELFSHVYFARHQYPAVAHILTHLVNLVFGPKSGFKSNDRARAWFGLQNEARLQLLMW